MGERVVSSKNAHGLHEMSNQALKLAKGKFPPQYQCL